MNNPMEMLKVMKNPQQMVMMLLKNNSNPIMSNLINMAEKGNSAEVEKIARNLCQQKNINFDNEFKNFMSNFKK